MVTHGSIGSYMGRKSKKDDQREVMSYRNDVSNSVWSRFYNEVVNRQYITEDNKKMDISISAIDTGYQTNFGYTFIDNTDYVIGVKGQEDSKFARFDDNAVIFKQSVNRDNLYILQSNKLKDQLSDRINLTWPDKEQNQPHGFLNFPQPSEGKFTMEFFRHYSGEP